MIKSQQKKLLKKLTFYCSGDDCHLIGMGQSRSGGVRVMCKKCKRTSTILKTPIDFSGWTDIDKILSKETYKYYAWKLRFDGLKAFYEKNGHTWVKDKTKVYYEWVSRQRYAMKEGKLHRLKVELLESIDFKLDYYDPNDEVTIRVRESRTAKRSKFSEQFKVVIAWKQKHDRWPVRRSKDNIEERELGRIISKWRTSDTLYKEEMDLLDSHGFVWNVNVQQFWDKIDRIKAFERKFKDYCTQDKSLIKYDKITARMIYDFRKNPPTAEWKLKAIKELNLGLAETAK
jgi:hypothetical protein